MADLTPHMVPIPCRILNETDTGYLVTQQPYGRTGIWIDKDKVTIRDRNAVQAHHVALMPADLAARKHLGEAMQTPRKAPSPWASHGDSHD
ncbi:hypothetical protein [uncultured Paracoccus sp.]|uniref:hypothetical protein n=1 Tax=uncultured Paracoccus sp. TaxID=189685 RepID=UPI0030DC6EFF